MVYDFAAEIVGVFLKHRIAYSWEYEPFSFDWRATTQSSTRNPDESD